MRYALTLTYGEPAAGEIPEEQMAAARAAFDAYAKSLEAAGVLRAAEVLEQSHATTTVTLREGSLEVQNGPYVESKEMLAGFFIIDVPDLDAALAWAEQCPAAQWGVIEIRPVAVAFLDGEWRA